MKIVIFLHVILFVLGCSKQSLTIKSSEGNLTESSPVNDLSFSGIDVIDNVMGVSVQINWTPATGGSVASYSILNLTSGTPVFVASVDENTLSYTVTGLTPGSTYEFQVKAVDTNGRVDSNSNIVAVTTLGINPPTAASYAPAIMVSTVGSSFTSATPSVTGGTVGDPITFSISPALPTGLSLDVNTGVISGTPTVLSNPTSYTVTATNSGGPITTTISLRSIFAGATSTGLITGAAVTINWTHISDALFYTVFNTTSGSPVFVGVAFAPDNSYVVTGLNASTTYNFIVRATSLTGVTDLNNSTVSATTLSIAPPSSLTYSKPSATYLLNVPITNNTPSYAGNPVTSFAIAPALPTGLSFNTSTGVISGTPTITSANSNYTVTATNAGGSTTRVISIGVSDFVGITSVSEITGNSAKINWTPHPSADGYRVYSVSGGTATFITYLASASASSYRITDLEPNTSYTYRINATATGWTDANANDAIFTTLDIGVTFTGWRNVKSLGPKVPAIQAPDILPESASVTLDWEEMDSTVPIVSYNIYRRNAVGPDCLDGAPFGLPIGSSTTRSYTDSTVTAEAVYCYKVIPVVTISSIDQEVDPALYTNAHTDTEIKVIVPPNNMVLMHRWMANKDMCQLMQRGEGILNGVDRSENYRCGYSGPGSTVVGFYDVGKSKIFDRYEMGVNWTPGDGGDGSLSCGNPTQGCWGAGGAGMAAVDGSVYWGRWGYPQVRVSGVWQYLGQDSHVPDAVAAASMSERPGLPPAHNFASASDNWHQRMCNLKTAGSFGPKRTLSRQEMFLLSAWHPDQYQNPLLVRTLETGLTITSNFGCLVDGGSGLDFEPAATYPVNPDMVRTGAIVRTGSHVTKNCISRYGAQDTHGNAGEILSDMMTCAGGICTGITSTIDPANNDWSGYIADGITDGPSPAGGMFLSGFQKYSLPLGLPVLSGNSSMDAISLGTAAGQFNTTTNFNGMSYFLFDFVASAKLFTHKSGSSYVGRYGFNFSSSVAGQAIGFRCATEAE